MIVCAVPFELWGNSSKKSNEYLVRISIKFVNTRPIKPLKPLLKLLAIKIKLISLPSIQMTIIDGEFSRIIKMENFSFSENNEENTFSNEKISELLEKYISSLENISPNVVAIAHDNFKERIGGIQTIMQLENRSIIASNGNYWTINPNQLRNSFTVSPMLSLLHNGKHIANIRTEDISELLGILKRNASDRDILIVIHSLLGHNPEKISKTLEAHQEIKQYFYLHDFYSICPSIKLLRNNLDFCNAPAITSWSCRICIYGEARGEHVSGIERVFKSPGISLVAPSKSTQDIWINNYGLEKNIAILPHLNLTPANQLKRERNIRPRIAFFGPPHREKGWNSFIAVAKLLLETHDFYVFSSHNPQVGGITFIELDNRSGDINYARDTLIENLIDYAFIYPMWPETYSLVTAEAISAGLFVLTNSNSGNVSTLVEEFRAGSIFENLDQMVNHLQSDLNKELKLQTYTAEFNGIVEQFIKDSRDE